MVHLKKAWSWARDRSASDWHKTHGEKKKKSGLNFTGGGWVNLLLTLSAPLRSKKNHQD